MSGAAGCLILTTADLPSAGIWVAPAVVLMGKAEGCCLHSGARDVAIAVRSLADKSVMSEVCVRCKAEGCGLGLGGDGDDTSREDGLDIPFEGLESDDEVERA